MRNWICQLGDDSIKVSSAPFRRLEVWVNEQLVHKGRVPILHTGGFIETTGKSGRIRIAMFPMAYSYAPLVSIFLNGDLIVGYEIGKLVTRNLGR